MTDHMKQDDDWTGHNSKAIGTAAAEVRAFVERIERLESDKADIASDIKEVYAEAKGRGFDTKALRSVISLRKQDRDAREEHQHIVDLYCNALGM